MEEEYSYDTWGRRRNAQDWTYTLDGRTPITDRGYCMHEHLDNFALINMNGRMYDPAVGQFLSPDPFVQAPQNTQNYNRYSYCNNNPLKYTDPSGNFLTWNINNGGFSIGFNLTPIGVPLGAGLNFGWGNGFSVGAYGEVGWRVGGTGLGSGITVSQSLDYNFKYNSWTTSTSGGAYASLGLFNAGANISQTYDMASLQWSSSWGVSAGIGFGNDARGIGFNVGYGSSGFSYGMGGYYNSHAWDSNPVYAPDVWNTDDLVEFNNCYSYARDEIYNGNYWGLQPGYNGENPVSEASEVTMDFVKKAALNDGRIKQPNFINKLGFGKKGYYSVYLAIDEGGDYHWYRQDKGGLWSHKPGITPVVNVDASTPGKLIRNPAYANLGRYNDGGIFLWIKR